MFDPTLVFGETFSLHNKARNNLKASKVFKNKTKLPPSIVFNDLSFAFVFAYYTNK